MLKRLLLIKHKSQIEWIVYFWSILLSCFFNKKSINIIISNVIYFSLLNWAKIQFCIYFKNFFLLKDFSKEVLLIYSENFQQILLIRSYFCIYINSYQIDNSIKITNYWVDICFKDFSAIKLRLYLKNLKLNIRIVNHITFINLNLVASAIAFRNKIFIIQILLNWLLFLFSEL